MIITIFILFNLLGFIAGASNGLMDLIQFHWNEAPEFMKKKSNFWNPKESWKRKYKDNDPKKEKTFIGKYATGFTDGWHMLKMIMKMSYSLAGSLPFYLIIGHWVIIPIGTFVLYIAFQFGFKSTYK